MHVHYNDLLKQPSSEIAKVALFLGIGLTNSELESIVKMTSFSHIKNNLNKLFPGGYAFFNGGANTFFHKGVNQRWKGVLGQNEMNTFHSVTERLLSKGCKKWLTYGAL